MAIRKTKGRKREMGIAALILGIISILIGFIPLCGSIALVPAIIGLILGIVDTVTKRKRGEKIAISVAGLVLSAIAIVIIVFWVFIFGVIISSADFNEVNQAAENYFLSLNEYHSTIYGY